MKRGLTEHHLLEFRVNVCARLQVFLRGKAEVPFVQGELADAKVAKVHRVSAAQLFDASQLRLRLGRVIAVTGMGRVGIALLLLLLWNLTCW